MVGSSRQVRDFLAIGKELHHAVGLFYAKLAETDGDERVRMLLDYLERHEKHMEKTLIRYEKSAQESLLNTWFEFSPTLDVAAVIHHCHLPEHPSVDDVFKAATHFGQALIEIYKEIAETAVDQESRRLFSDLLHLEQSEENLAVRAMLGLQDL